MSREFSLTKVRQQSEQIWNDQVGGLGLRILGGLIGISLVGLGWGYGRLPAEVPLWFSRPWGATQLAHPAWLMLLPGSLIVMSGMAIALAGAVYEQEKLLARMVIWGVVVIGFLLTYALGQILRLGLGG